MKIGSFSTYKLILIITFLLGIPNLYAQVTISPASGKLDFGAFVNVSGGTVTLNPCSGLTTPSVNNIKFRNGSYATVTISSPQTKGKSWVTLTLTPTIDSQTLTNGEDNLQLSNFSLCINGSQIGLTPPSYTYKFKVDHATDDLPLTINIGGDLNVPAGASAGTYESITNFTVSVQ